MNIIEHPLLTKTICERKHLTGIEKQFNNPIFHMFTSNHLIQKQVPDDEVYVVMGDHVFCNPQVARVLREFVVEDTIYNRIMRNGIFS